MTTGPSTEVEIRGLEMRAATGFFTATGHDAAAVAIASSSSMAVVTGQSIAHLEGIAPPGSVATGRLGPLPISIGTLLETGEQWPEGVLVLSTRAGWREIINRFTADPTQLYRVDPRTLEEIVAGALVEEGLFDDVILTPRSGDGGRDIIATKRGRFPRRLFCEVKRYGPDEIVTAEQVSAFMNLRAVDLRLTNALYTTTGSFAPRLRTDQRVAPYLAGTQRGSDVGCLTLIEGTTEMLKWFQEANQTNQGGTRAPRSHRDA
jgi:restriction system protein